MIHFILQGKVGYPKSCKQYDLGSSSKNNFYDKIAQSRNMLEDNSKYFMAIKFKDSTKYLTNLQ